MNTRLGEIDRCAAITTRIGMKITTTGVLFKNAEITAAPMRMNRIGRNALAPPMRPSLRAGASIASVANRPWPTINSAMTVASAGLEKPASSRSGSSTAPSTPE